MDYRIIGVDGRPRRLRRDKVVYVSPDIVALWPSEEALKRLRVHDGAREQARRSVNLETLWSLVIEGGGSTQTWNLQELREMHDDGGSVEPRPVGAEQAITLLQRAALREDSPESAALMQAAHLHGAASAFDVLVRLGHWSRDENLELHRLRIPDEFPATLLASV